MKSKILSVLLSVALAFGLWLYVITVVDPESESSYYDVPVVFDGVSQLDSRDLMITAGTDVTVDLNLLGNRTDLNKLDRTNITILADLSRITEPGEHTVKYSISYPSSAGAIEVLDQDPQFITVQVSRRITEEVPVRVQYTGSLPENFVADVQNAVLDHATVTVTGPEELVNKIEYASVSVDLTGRMENIVETCRHTLCSADGRPVEDVSAVTVNVSEIRLTVKVWQIKQIPVEILIIDGGGLTAEEITATPSLQSILVSGAASDLVGFDKIELVIDLNQITDSKVLEFPIELPENVKNESGVTKVSVDVQVPKMDTITLFIPKEKIIKLNVPENMTVEIYMQRVPVVVQGRENRLKELTEDNIRIYLDCSEITLGPDYYYYTIEIIGIDDVGVVYGTTEYRVLAIASNIKPGPGI